jgi:hypothetical protein
MSKVSIKSLVVKPKPVPVYRLTVDLTERDAEVLHAIFRNIAGDPKGDRAITEKIRTALLAYGVASGTTNLVGEINLRS